MAKKKKLEDLELLKNLYMIASPSGDEKKMRKFITKWIRKHVPEAFVEIDVHGNILVTKGVSETYPVQVAHIDEVHERKNGLILMIGNDLIGGRNANNYLPEGIGGDDKNGIYVALKLLQKHDVIKCAFFVGEEVGCVGSSKVDMSFFDDARFVLECDRKGSSDFVTNIGWGYYGTDLSTDEWIEAIGLDKFGYAPHDGGLTDVKTLKTRGLNVCCANMSCGYYNPHTDEEVTVLSELQNTFELCDHIITNLTDVYPHEHVSNDYGYYGYCGGGYKEPKTYKAGDYVDWYDDENSYYEDAIAYDNELEVLMANMETKILSYPDILDFNLAEYFRVYRGNYPHLMASDFEDTYFSLVGCTWKSNPKYFPVADKPTQQDVQLQFADAILYVDKKLGKGLSPDELQTAMADKFPLLSDEEYVKLSKLFK